MCSIATVVQETLAVRYQSIEQPVPEPAVVHSAEPNITQICKSESYMLYIRKKYT